MAGVAFQVAATAAGTIVVLGCLAAAAALGAIRAVLPVLQLGGLLQDSFIEGTFTSNFLSPFVWSHFCIPEYGGVSTFFTYYLPSLGISLTISLGVVAIHVALATRRPVYSFANKGGPLEHRPRQRVLPMTPEGSSVLLGMQLTRPHGPVTYDGTPRPIQDGNFPLKDRRRGAFGLYQFFRRDFMRSKDPVAMGLGMLDPLAIPASCALWKYHWVFCDTVPEDIWVFRLWRWWTLLLCWLILLVDVLLPPICFAILRHAIVFSSELGRWHDRYAFAINIRPERSVASALRELYADQCVFDVAPVTCANESKSFKPIHFEHLRVSTGALRDELGPFNKRTLTPHGTTQVLHLEGPMGPRKLIEVKICAGRWNELGYSWRNSVLSPAVKRRLLGFRIDGNSSPLLLPGSGGADVIHLPVPVNLKTIEVALAERPEFTMWVDSDSLSFPLTESIGPIISDGFFALPWPSKAVDLIIHYAVKSCRKKTDTDLELPLAGNVKRRRIAGQGRALWGADMLRTLPLSLAFFILSWQTAGPQSLSALQRTIFQAPLLITACLVLFNESVIALWTALQRERKRLPTLEQQKLDRTGGGTNDFEVGVRAVINRRSGRTVLGLWLATFSLSAGFQVFLCILLAATALNYSAMEGKAAGACEILAVILVIGALSVPLVSRGVLAVKAYRNNRYATRAASLVNRCIPNVQNHLPKSAEPLGSAVVGWRTRAPPLSAPSYPDYRQKLKLGTRTRDPDPHALPRKGLFLSDFWILNRNEEALSFVTRNAGPQFENWPTEHIEICDSSTGYHGLVGVRELSTVLAFGNGNRRRAALPNRDVTLVGDFSCVSLQRGLGGDTISRALANPLTTTYSHCAVTNRPSTDTRPSFDASSAVLRNIMGRLPINLSCLHKAEAEHSMIIAAVEVIAGSAVHVFSEASKCRPAMPEREPRLCMDAGDVAISASRAFNLHLSTQERFRSSVDVWNGIDERWKTPNESNAEDVNHLVATASFDHRTGTVELDCFAANTRWLAGLLEPGSVCQDVRLTYADAVDNDQSLSSDETSSFFASSLSWESCKISESKGNQIVHVDALCREVGVIRFMVRKEPCLSLPIYVGPTSWVCVRQSGDQHPPTVDVPRVIVVAPGDFEVILMRPNRWEFVMRSRYFLPYFVGGRGGSKDGSVSSRSGLFRCYYYQVTATCPYMGSSLSAIVSRREGEQRISLKLPPVRVENTLMETPILVDEGEGEPVELHVTDSITKLPHPFSNALVFEPGIDKNTFPEKLLQSDVSKFGILNCFATESLPHEVDQIRQRLDEQIAAPKLENWRRVSLKLSRSGGGSVHLSISILWRRFKVAKLSSVEASSRRGLMKPITRYRRTPISASMQSSFLEKDVESCKLSLEAELRQSPRSELPLVLDVFYLESNESMSLFAGIVDRHSAWVAVRSRVECLLAQLRLLELPHYFLHIKRQSCLSILGYRRCNDFWNVNGLTLNARGQVARPPSSIGDQIRSDVARLKKLTEILIAEARAELLSSIRTYVTLMNIITSSGVIRRRCLLDRMSRHLAAILAILADSYVSRDAQVEAQRKVSDEFAVRLWEQLSEKSTDSKLFYVQRNADQFIPSTIAHSLILALFSPLLVAAVGDMIPPDYDIRTTVPRWRREIEAWAIGDLGYPDYASVGAIWNTRQFLRYRRATKGDGLQPKLEECQRETAWWRDQFEHPLASLVLQSMGLDQQASLPSALLSKIYQTSLVHHVVTTDAVLWEDIRLRLSDFESEAKGPSMISACEYCPPPWLPPCLPPVHGLVRLWCRDQKAETLDDWLQAGKDLPSYAGLVWSPMNLRLTSGELVLEWPNVGKKWTLPLGFVERMFVTRIDPSVDLTPRTDTSFAKLFPRWRTKINGRQFESKEWSHDWKLVIVPLPPDNWDYGCPMPMFDPKTGLGSNCITYQSLGDDPECFTLTMGKVLNKEDISEDQWKFKEILGLHQSKTTQTKRAGRNVSMLAVCPLTVRLTENDAAMWSSVIRAAKMDRADGRQLLVTYDETFEKEPKTSLFQNPTLDSYGRYSHNAGLLRALRSGWRIKPERSDDSSSMVVRDPRVSLAVGDVIHREKQPTNDPLFIIPGKAPAKNRQEVDAKRESSDDEVRNESNIESSMGG